MKLVSFSLKPVAPFRLDYTVWALRRRPDNIVDRWEDGRYQRVFDLGTAVFAVSVVQRGFSRDPVLEVKVEGDKISPEDIKTIGRRLTRILGLNVELADFYALAKKDELLGPLAREFQGVKPPRFGSVYEALVNAVACQQMSLLVGVRLLNRLAQAYGKSFADSLSYGPQYAFPSPDVLAEARPAAVRALGFSGRKAQYIKGISCFAAGNPGSSGCGKAGSATFDIEALEALADEEAETKLESLEGVGRWSAQYVLLRGMGRLGVFPGDDVGARAKLKEWLAIEAPLDYEGVRRIAARWRPYGGLVYFHLLLKNLKAKGLFLPMEREEVSV